MDEKIIICLRLTPELKYEIEERAFQENRSRENLIRTAILAYLKNTDQNAS